MKKAGNTVENVVGFYQLKFKKMTNEVVIHWSLS